MTRHWAEQGGRHERRGELGVERERRARPHPALVPSLSWPANSPPRAPPRPEGRSRQATLSAIAAGIVGASRTRERHDGAAAQLPANVNSGAEIYQRRVQASATPARAKAATGKDDGGETRASEARASPPVLGGGETARTCLQRRRETARHERGRPHEAAVVKGSKAPSLEPTEEARARRVRCPRRRRMVATPSEEDETRASADPESWSAPAPGEWERERQPSRTAVVERHEPGRPPTCGEKVSRRRAPRRFGDQPITAGEENGGEYRQRRESRGPQGGPNPCAARTGEPSERKMSRNPRAPRDAGIGGDRIGYTPHRGRSGTGRPARSRAAPGTSRRRRSGIGLALATGRRPPSRRARSRLRSPRRHRRSRAPRARSARRLHGDLALGQGRLEAGSEVPMLARPPDSRTAR